MSVYLLFALTVIPLIFTPGPDMLFILSQVMGKGAKAGIMATLGVCSGYLVHSVLVALGIAAIIVSFPILFDTIRWLGIAYLLFLAFTLIKSVFSQNKIVIENKIAEVTSPIDLPTPEALITHQEAIENIQAAIEEFETDIVKDEVIDPYLQESTDDEEYEYDPWELDR